MKAAPMLDGQSGVKIAANIFTEFSPPTGYI
jgi:hypothetical protein